MVSNVDFEIFKRALGARIKYLIYVQGFKGIKEFARFYNHDKEYRDFGRFLKGTNARLSSIARIAFCLSIDVPSLLNLDLDPKFLVQSESKGVDKWVQIFSKNIQFYRKSKVGIQLDVEIKTGKNRTNVSKYETLDLDNPTLETIVILANVFGIEPFKLFIECEN